MSHQNNLCNELLLTLISNKYLFVCKRSKGNKFQFIASPALSH